MEVASTGHRRAKAQNNSINKGWQVDSTNKWVLRTCIYLISEPINAKSRVKQSTVKPAANSDTCVCVKQQKWLQLNRAACSSYMYWSRITATLCTNQLSGTPANQVLPPGIEMLSRFCMVETQLICCCEVQSDHCHTPLKILII